MTFNSETNLSSGSVHHKMFRLKYSMYSINCGLCPFSTNLDPSFHIFSSKIRTQKIHAISQAIVSVATLGPASMHPNFPVVKDGNVALTNKLNGSSTCDENCWNRKPQHHPTLRQDREGFLCLLKFLRVFFCFCFCGVFCFLASLFLWLPVYTIVFFLFLVMFFYLMLLFSSLLKIIVRPSFWKCVAVCSYGCLCCLAQPPCGQNASET